MLKHIAAVCTLHKELRHHGIVICAGERGNYRITVFSQRVTKQPEFCNARAQS